MMDDRTIADTVNTVRDIALNYHHTEQLRARLAHVLVPHLKRIAELERQQSEPFGYFKAEPFGWTDCAKTDDGAKALYERPDPRVAELERVQGVLVGALEKIASPSQTVGLLWWQEEARDALATVQKPAGMRKVYLVPRDDGSFEELEHCPHGCGPDDVAVAYVPVQKPEGGDRG